MDIPTDWTFKTSKVAEAFDAHVREQLPWYELATGAAAHVARHYLPVGGRMYDIGGSTGNIGRALADTIKARGIELVALDNSQAMVDAYVGPGQAVLADATEYTFEPFDVAVCFLVLMFMPVSRRRKFIANLVATCRPGGAIIVLDKTTIDAGYCSTVLHRLTIAGKVAQGAPADQIIAKELSLSGVQRPLPPRFMEFACPSIEFFRFGEFAAWVIEAHE